MLFIWWVAVLRKLDFFKYHLADIFNFTCHVIFEYDVSVCGTETYEETGDSVGIIEFVSIVTGFLDINVVIKNTEVVEVEAEACEYLKWSYEL